MYRTALAYVFIVLISGLSQSEVNALDIGAKADGRTDDSGAKTKVNPDTGVRFTTSDAKLQALYDLAEKKETENIRVGKDGRKVLVEGDEWSYGLWLETQPMGGVMYAKRDLAIARNNIEFFLEFQKENGLLPCTCIRAENGDVTGWHGSLGLLSLAQASLDFYYLAGKDKALLERSYRALETYDAFLWKYRDSDGDGCLEVWGIGDTGEDQTTRFNRAPHVVQDPMTPPHNPEWDVPVQSMDIMSDSYVARSTLAEMSRLLGNGQESKWRKRAQDVRDKLKAYLWRPELHACYDRDKTRKFIECLCHNNLRCMYRGSFTQEMADEFVKYHLMNPREFWTYMPLPSISLDNSYFTDDEVRGYCHWAGPSQGLTYQRAIRALENYGHFAEVTLLGRKLIAGLSGLKAFPVCFVPTTGKPRGEHGNYGPTVLSALEYISRLYGVHIYRDQVYWSGIPDGAHSTSYVQYWLGKEFKLENANGAFSGYLNGKKLFSCTAGVRVVTDVSGTVREVVGIDSGKRTVVLETPEIAYQPAQIEPNQVLAPAGKALALSRSAPFAEPSGLYEVDAKTNQELVKFTGAWETVPAADAYCKTMALSRQPGDAAQFEFVGTEIGWIGKRCPNYGLADVFIDGRLEARNVDLYGANPQESQQVLFSKKGLSSGTHTIKIVVNGTKNAKASDAYVGIDAFQYGEHQTRDVNYLTIPATGFWSSAGAVPEGFDPAFAEGLYGWSGSKSGSAAAFQFKVRPSGKYLVAIGFFDPNTKPGIRIQEIVIDGKKVDTLDTAGAKPFVRLYEVADLNGDGFLQVSSAHVKDEGGATGMMNIIWLFDADQRKEVDAEKLARGTILVKPLCRLDVSSADRIPREHVNFPKLSEEQLKRMLPLRPVALGIEPARPQPVDPLHLEIQGELRNRIQTVLDRWGYAGRDQKLVAGFLADAGFDTSARWLEVSCMFSRLLKVDLDLQVPFEALLARQEKTGELAGAFPGGAGTPRLACSWEQGILLQAMLAYYEHSGGDPRALQAAGRIVDWEDRMTSGKINVGSWGGNGRFGALEGLVTYTWRTKDPRALAVAKKIAELNRAAGGIRWMFRGEPAKDAGEHLHSCLTTVRGFPWLYAYTADRSYLDDAVAANDRIYDNCTWANGCVSEWTAPEVKHCFATDETCCTADEIMLSYQLADLTGEGRFFDRADVLYYNALRFHQWFDGNFSGYDDPHIGVKGPHMWYCCTWWGSKALYETARHLYASSPTEVYVNGFMPSQAELPLKDGAVRVATAANIPASGNVRITVTPKETSKFTLNVRVPAWATLRAVEVNGQSQAMKPISGYISLRRNWSANDRVDVHFDLPLRVVLDNGQGPTPLAEGKVSLDGAAPTSARSIVIYRGPAILAQFRLQNGCDLIWAYTGDDPYLFETVASVPDEFTLAGQTYRSSGMPDLVKITSAPSGVRLEWTWKTGPAGDWEIRRTAYVKPGLPLEIDYTAEIIAPSGTPAKQIEEVVQTGRFCGIRMTDTVSVPSTFFTKTGRPIPPRLILDGVANMPTENQWLPAKDAELDNDSVRYQVHADANLLMAGGHRKAGYDALYNATVKDLLGASVAVSVDLGYSAIYSAAVKQNGRYVAKCRLTITGQSQFE